MAAIITLTTDFGYADGYVAVMKGVILGINPDARLVDITHSVRPQDISSTAFVIGNVYRSFPEGTIHLVVIDPGVGTRRKPLILKTPFAYFIAPDNGVLSYIINDYADRSQHIINIASLVEAVVISNTAYSRQPVSNTFHGRDIFAPVAAHLSLGIPLSKFGRPLTSINIIELPRPCRMADGSLTGEIIHIDNFGNLISCIREKDISGREVKITVGGKTISGLSTTYAGSRKLIALFGSSGYLEIAFRDGNAAEYLKATVGNQVVITG